MLSHVQLIPLNTKIIDVVWKNIEDFMNSELWIQFDFIKTEFEVTLLKFQGQLRQFRTESQVFKFEIYSWNLTGLLPTQNILHTLRGIGTFTIIAATSHLLFLNRVKKDKLWKQNEVHFGEVILTPLLTAND